MNQQQFDTPTPATVFIVDDEESARTSLQRLLQSYGYEAITFPSAAEFLAQPPFEGHGCLLLDLQMPKMSGLELQQELTRRGCDLPIVFLTARGDISTSVKAMKQGAEDYLPKLADERDLLDAVEKALERSSESLEQRRQQDAGRAMSASLTDREREVCEYVIGGMLNKQIAHRLDIAERTVKAHRSKVMEKLGVESVAELVRVADLIGIKFRDD